MNFYKHSLNIKIGLFLIGIAVTFALFALNWYFIKAIRQDARQQVEHLAVAYSDAINNTEGDDIRYVMEYIMPTIHFPIIITSADGTIYAWKNLNLTISDSEAEFDAKLVRLAEQMDQDFEPLEVILVADQTMKIHYGDSTIIKQLQWLPYLEIAGILIFIIIGFVGFQVIRKSEKNFIWAGLAREAAHQLGTPISSLLGWVNLIEDDHDDPEMILQGMHQDLQRLQDISERFHKIGSKPLMEDIELRQLSERICSYMRSRIPASSKMSIRLKGEDVLDVEGERILISWAIENLIKNALDAGTGGRGEITVSLAGEPETAVIDIMDTGSGIPRRHRNDIFKPGYSTKKRGWGLGLSLTRRIVEEIHHGKLRLLRSRPGETVFRLHLPRRQK